MSRTHCREKNERPQLMAKCAYGEHGLCPGVLLLETWPKVVTVPEPYPSERCACGCHVDPWPFPFEAE